MKRRRLWYLALISGFGILLLTTAKPVGEQVTYMPRWEHVNKTCRARDCDDAINLRQLHDIENYMNTSADPCESFHSYACGNWPSEHVNSTTTIKIANDRLTARYIKLFENYLEVEGETSKSTENLQRIAQARKACATQNCLPARKSLTEISENPEEEFLTMSSCKGNCVKAKTSINNWEPHKDTVLKKMLKYYKVCKSQQSKISLHAYMDLIKTRLNLNVNNYDWLNTLAEFARFGYSSHFLNMNVVQLNKSLHRIVINPHNIDQSIELNSELYDVLKIFTKDTRIKLQQRFKELELSLFQASCQHCITTPIELNTSNDNYELDCDCYKNEEITFSSLNTQLPDIDWQHYLSSQLARQIEANEILEVVNLNLIKQQVNYIKQIDGELNLLYTLASFLSYLVEQKENFMKHNSTEMNCLHHMRKIFHLPMTYIYENAIYSSIREKSENVVQEIFKELKLHFAKTIERNKMEFSSTILQQLQTKLNNVKINIGNLPFNVTNLFYSDFIAPYNFNDDFHYNHLHALEVFFKQYNSLLDVSSNELYSIWHTFNIHLPHFPDNLDATPYYYARSNLIVIPYSYLQTPFFDANFWPALLYGDLANTLGHELMHAFDTEFLKYDSNGNPSGQLLSNMFLNTNFCENLNCLERGTEFVRERIADVSGTRLALNTFLNLDSRALQRNGQLYFLQFAQFFCGTTDALTFKLEDFTHDMDRLRLDYVLGVMPEFAEVFNCPIGSGMNPVQKCEMYR